MDLKLLDLARFRPAAPVVAPRFDELAQVRAYWEALREGDRLPRRAALDPRGLSGVLDRVFIAERIGRGVLQVRIAGSSLIDFAGIDLRGLPLGCLFTATSRPALADLLEEVCMTPSLAQIDLAPEGDPARTVARLMLLPLAEDGDRRLVLGAFGFAEGRAPARARFHPQRRQVERLFPNPPAPARDPDAPVRASGHLRLVHSRA
jgi:hypothetical protein